MAVHLREAILSGCRERIREDDIIEFRAKFLPPPERDILISVWIHHQPIRMVARVHGVSAMTVRRQVRRLIDLVHSDEFVGAIRLMRYLHGPQAELARRVFCQRTSVRRAAEAVGVSYHEARRLIREAKGFIEGFKEVQADKDGRKLERGALARLEAAIRARTEET